jgi:uncharacterized protein YndB with AHSA1/START domain
MPVTHHSFTIVRTYPYSPAQVFDAWADPAKKALWFGAPERIEVVDTAYDFREGGHEHATAHHTSGMVTTFDADYVSIVPNERIVYTYGMTLDGKPLSGSVTCVEFAPVEGGTVLTFTEHGVHLDGLDDGTMRTQGSESLLDAIGVTLETLHP